VTSWTNATAPEVAGRGVLRPAETARLTDLRREYPVAPELQPFVERYWSVRWDLVGRPAFRAEVLSHASVNLSLESGSHPRFGVCLPAALLHGVVSRRFALDLAGWGRVTAVKFRPGGFTAMTGLQVRRDTVCPAPLDVIADPPSLAGAVLAEQSDARRVALVEGALLPLARSPSPVYTDLLDLMADMQHNRTLLRVEQVAATAGLTVRALQRLFSRYIGVGPKAVLARYRLHDALTSMDSGQVDDLADLAASMGWFDQAHFSRDFRREVGVTPSSYLSRVIV